MSGYASVTITGDTAVIVQDAAPTIIEVIAQGPQGPQGPQGAAGATGATGAAGTGAVDFDSATRPSYVSGHEGTMTRGMAVCLVNGLLRRATSVAPFHIVIGLLLEDSLEQGVSGRIQSDLIFTTTTNMWDSATGMAGGLSPNQLYFLTSTGAITPYPPTAQGQYVVSVGIALDSTSLKLGNDRAILL